MTAQAESSLRPRGDAGPHLPIRDGIGAHWTADLGKKGEDQPLPAGRFRSPASIGVAFWTVVLVFRTGCLATPDLVDRCGNEDDQEATARISRPRRRWRRSGATWR